MIAKISTGSGFRGALDYVFKADADVIGGNMAGDDPRSLAREFGITRALREDIKKPCYHVSLALPKGEELDAKQWEKVANKYLTRMGIDPLEHQYILVRHKDTEFSHIHILTSRIALNGGVWKPEYDKMKSKDICRQLEKEHGLTVISNEKRQYRAQTTQKERRMAARTGREPEKVFVQKKMNKILTEGASLHPQAFCSELEKHGIIAIPNVSKTGKMNGFAFQYAGRSYTGSQVGYSWKNLKKFIEIAPEDTYWMQERKNRLQEGTPADAVRSIRNAVWEVGIQGVPFGQALEKQGWNLKDGRMTKGSSSLDLSSVVDETALKANLDELNSYSKKVKERAQAKSRALAKNYYARPRRTFLAEMRTEDVICAMVLFPQVTVFLLVLSVLTEAVRTMEKPKTEAEFRERMRGIWKEADETVQLEVSRIKEEMKNARTPGSHTPDKPKPEEPRRGLREESHGGQQRVREVGAAPDSPSGGIEGYPRRNEGGQGLPALETKNLDSDDGDGVSWGSSPSPSVAVPARGKQPNVPADTVARAVGIEAIEEWASLAQDISVLARGENMSKGKEKSKSVLYKEQVWGRQHSALQAPLYRLTVRGRGEEDGKVINLGKPKDKGAPTIDSSFGRVVSNAKNEPEILWTAEGVKSKIPTLEYWNARGYDIYLTPIDDKYHHILLDDLTAEGVAYIRGQYDVSLVQTSSKDNFQAIIRVPKKEVSTEEQSAANELLRTLNHLPDGCGGDKSISAPRHPFRMVGFNNKKPNKNNVQTKIEYMKPDTTCERATKELQVIREERAITRAKDATWQRRTAIETIRDRTIQRPDGETSADKDFRFRWNKFHGLAKKNVRIGIWQNVDDSAIDFRVCTEMMQAGYSEEDTALALQRCSPGLFDRHRNPDDYVRRTVSAAMQEIIREAPKNEPQIQGPFFGR